EKAAEANRGKELVPTAIDLRILAHLAEYHSLRLLAGVQYNLYKQTGDLFALDDAIHLERQAVAAWERIVSAAGDVYASKLAVGVNGMGFPRHWSEELERLRGELRQLERERTTAADGDSAIAHVPVRKLGLNGSFKIRATVSSTAKPVRVNALVAARGELRPPRMQTVSERMYQGEVDYPAREGQFR
ncbi:MAG: hypothetical protein GY953_34930, partial [bacterium]|nr:hypothetical protein [bacterium]